MSTSQNYGLFGVSIIRHLVFRDPGGDHNSDNHPYVYVGCLYRCIYMDMYICVKVYCT